MTDRLKILIVGDCAAAADRLTELLGGGVGPIVRPAAAVAELADVMASDAWDVVLTNDLLTDGDARDVLDRVRRADPDLPVLVVGDGVGKERALALMAAGVDDVLSRTDLDRLGRTMRQRMRIAHERRLRRAADAACGTESELHGVVDLIPVGIMVHHGTTIAYVNRALAGYFGREPATMLGRPVVELMRPEYRASMLNRMALIDRGEVLAPFEFRFDREDGRPGMMELTAAQHLRFGGLPSVLATLRDVTEERALRDRLQMADRMAAVGTLAAGVAHEINNPLACVTANLEVLREELAPALHAEAGAAPQRRMGHAEMLAALDDAREGAERVRVIVRDLRLFARGEAGGRGPVDLGGVLQAAERMAANMVKARARVVQEHAPLPPVDGNATRLCQVFVNILINAAQAIELGHADDNEVYVRAAVEGERVVVEVSDTGVGIPADVRARIFDPFFSTRGIGGGHGLGLSVCHGIVTSFGGDITVGEAATGRGTVVRVTLPIWSP